VLRKSLCSARWKFSKAVPKYQNTIQNPYVPRPPQSPSAPLKRMRRSTAHQTRSPSRRITSDRVLTFHGLCGALGCLRPFWTGKRLLC
jgi:hypothetical protein